MRATLARNGAWLVLLAVCASSLAGGWAISLAVPIPERDEFNVLRWELHHVPGKWLYLTGRFFEGGLSREEEDERLGRYLTLTARIRQLQRAPDEAELGALLDEREELENDVEAVIEGRLTAVLQDAGLESSLPLFPDARWVWPPVDVEFDAPPRSLAISPRSRIELVERLPLRAGLSLDEVVAIEAEEEASGERSAIVGSLAGAATYPSIVGPRANYEQLVSTIAHEWVHHYLAFKPLGQRYYDSLDLRTLNETVANLAGEELAALLVARYPLSGDAAEQLAGVAPDASGVDTGAVLRQLRLDVEELLDAGEIEQAEALMERRRLELAEQGVVYRRINQAFFASIAIYADEPGSIDPIGEKLHTLREDAGSVGAFLRTASGLTSADDLDAALGR